MQSNLIKYSVREQLCVHSLACMSMDMDWKTYEGKFISSRLSQLTIESVAEGYDVISPNQTYMELLRELPKSDKKSSLSIARRLVALSMRNKTETNASHSNSIQSPLNMNSMERASTSTPQRRSNRKKKRTKRFHSSDYIEYESSKEEPDLQDSVIIKTEDPSHEIPGPSGLSSTLSSAQNQSVNRFHSSDYIKNESSEEDPDLQDSIIIKTEDTSLDIAGSSRRSPLLSAAQIQSINENNKRLLSLGKLLREKKSVHFFNQPKANLILDKMDAKKLLQSRNVRHSRIGEYCNTNSNRLQPNPSRVIGVRANNAKKQRLDEAVVAEANREWILDLVKKFNDISFQKRFFMFIGYDLRTAGLQRIERHIHNMNTNTNNPDDINNNGDNAAHDV